ncbi:hypothetical protein FisN_5Lh073 [Fistulifera solaris]|uniref:Uncharacterized protein n=1 Tax=Fistulifera solaris TaxID=1519565 RepID=A0A1Z5JJ15_FISSO|nr:hypothetical protein FisN_5Lh073 [Fistulifera solaris]|eukprot:GAX14010.1 hypothetical protein FisN_5Lh073 [Fistulifera solaris]
MIELAVSRIRKIRKLEDTISVTKQESINNFTVVCESELALYDDWGGLTQTHYAEFLAQYCQTSPGNTCQPQISNFWNIDLQFQKTFLSPGCPQDAEQNEQCIDYLLQNNPQTLLYAGNLTQLCALTGSLLITTGLMQFPDMEGDVEQEGRDTGNAPNTTLTTALTATPVPSVAPTMIRSKSPIAETSEKIDENNLSSRLLMHFGIVLVIFGLCLGMMFAYIRRLRHKKRKNVVVQSEKNSVRNENRPRIPRTSTLVTNDGSPHSTDRNSESGRIKREAPRSAPITRMESRMEHEMNSIKTPLPYCSAGDSNLSRVPSCSPVSDPRGLSSTHVISKSTSLESFKCATVQNNTSGESKLSRDDEEFSHTVTEHENTAMHVAAEGPWIVECTNEEEHLTLSMLRNKVSSTSTYEHCQVIEMNEDETCDTSKSMVACPNSMDEDNLQEAQNLISLGVLLQSTETFNSSIQNRQGCGAVTTESPAICELVDLTNDTSSFEGEFIQPTTTSGKPEFDYSPKHEDSMSIVSVRWQEEPTCRFIGASVLVEEVEKATTASTSVCKQPHQFLYKSSVESKGCNNLSTIVAGKSDEIICDNVHRKGKVEEMRHKASRTSVDPPDNDVVIGCNGARIRIQARCPVSHQADLPENSDSDDNSTDMISRNSPLSVESAKIERHPAFDEPAILDNGHALGFTRSQLLEANLAMYSACDRNEQSIMDCLGGNSQSWLPQISIDDQTVIDGISETSSHSIAHVHAFTDEPFSQHPHLDNISLKIQACYSDLSMEELFDKPRVKAKSWADGISLDNSSHSAEWSMESSIRQTFFSFKHNISHAIADLNNTTVETTSLLGVTEIEKKSTPHDNCSIDP